VKAGVLLRRGNQTDEREMFGNRVIHNQFFLTLPSLLMPACSTELGSGYWELFLSCLGDRVALRDWPHFTGGLHTSGRTGDHSVYRRTDSAEIMYHVSTLLPHSATDAQQACRVEVGHHCFEWLNLFV
jgi:hypothetical protein